MLNQARDCTILCQILVETIVTDDKLSEGPNEVCWPCKYEYHIPVIDLVYTSWAKLCGPAPEVYLCHPNDQMMKHSPNYGAGDGLLPWLKNKVVVHGLAVRENNLLHCRIFLC